MRSSRLIKRPIVTLLSIALPLIAGGCVAAAVPIAAGGMIAKRQTGASTTRQRGAATRPDPSPASRQDPDGSAPRATLVDLKSLPPPRPGAADAGLGVYHPLLAYLRSQIAADRTAWRGTVAAPDATLDALTFLPCGDAGPAVIFDLDEEAEGGDPDARWRRWRGDPGDSLTATPGLAEAVREIRRLGISVMFVSARSADSEPGVRATLDRFDLGPVAPEELVLTGGGESRGPARQTIAARHCVLAMVGDVPGDFGDPLAGPDAIQQNALAAHPALGRVWNAGWFLLPNPLRSSWRPTGANR